MKKFFLFVLLFILVELYLLILLGQYIGPAYTIVYVVFVAISGYVLVHKCLMYFKNVLFKKLKIHELRFPELFDWFVSLMGAVLVLIPGLITDILGILLIVKQFRQRIMRLLWPLIKDSEFIKLFKIRLREELKKKGLQDFMD